MSKQNRSRRAVLAGFGAIAAAGALGTRHAEAQASSPVATPFTPTQHSEDAWMSAVPGQHRVVVDVTSADGVPDGLRFAGNLLTAHKSGYGVDEADVAVIVCLRHGATAYGYADAIWSKYGRTFDAKTTPPPSANPYNSGSRTQVADLAKRGVRFMVCGLASRGLAGRVAGQGGDADAILKEFGANLVPNGRIVPAGVVGVTHAQERGFALLHVG
jgi:intracellular sulfur oxidation DsrE/DsrF family protein